MAEIIKPTDPDILKTLLELGKKEEIVKVTIDDEILQGRLDIHDQVLLIFPPYFLEPGRSIVFLGSGIGDEKLYFKNIEILEGEAREKLLKSIESNDVAFEVANSDIEKTIESIGKRLGKG